MTKFSEGKKSVVVAAIGEALFDCFSDRTILGGAPLNLIVHMQQLLALSGGQGILVSRVGDDELGRALLAEVASRGLPTDVIQVDPVHPTGQVQVEISPEGDPEYHIALDAAWDFIEFEEPLGVLVASASAVCFGTLAQRHPVSRAAIQRFVAAAPQALRVLDVNLRQDYYSSQILAASLELANVVKLNEEELARLSSLLPEKFGNAAGVDEQADALLRAFDLKVLALTRGARGTVLFTKGERSEGAPSVVGGATGGDSVGAGDACCAGLIYGLLMDWPLERTLELANRMGAYVASQPGGTPWLPQELLKFAAERAR